MTIVLEKAFLWKCAGDNFETSECGSLKAKRSFLYCNWIFHSQWTEHKNLSGSTKSILPTKHCCRNILSFIISLLFQNLCRIYALFRKKSKICRIFGKADYMFFHQNWPKYVKKYVLCFYIECRSLLMTVFKIAMHGVSLLRPGFGVLFMAPSLACFAFAITDSAI